jgi:pseudouridine synthase
MKQRLQKVLSQAGITSRRKAEALILSGRIRVDDKLITNLGTKVDLRTQFIEIDGYPLKIPSLVYIMLYKPRNYLTTLYDPLGRPKVKDLLKDLSIRVFPVGRLDFDTEGLLLLTNDGEFANHLIHPRYKKPKTYLVKVKGNPDVLVLKKLREGVKLEERKTGPAQIKLVRTSKDNSWLEITIYEGRYHQIKRMCEAVGHPVLHLKRIRIASLSLDRLRPGEYRFLTDKELNQLKE